MNRIDKKFKELKAKEKKAFISYVTAGDPDMQTSRKVISELAANGADIIELGVPFSDPLADGPTIQGAVKRSLDAGCTVKKVFDMVKGLRKTVDTPFVFMTYYNIIYNYGVEKFIKDSKNIGVDGVIVPDLPLEESADIIRFSKKYGLCVILLTAPTTKGPRYSKIAAASRGFVYYVSVTGVTGARGSFSGQLKRDVKELKKLNDTPLCVGFGVSDPKQAKEISSFSDGVIVGSAIIKIIEKNVKNKKVIPSKIGKFAASLAKAIHS